MRVVTLFLTLICLCLAARPAIALDSDLSARLAGGDSDEKISAISQLVEEAPAEALTILQALSEGRLASAGSRLVIIDGDTARDAVSGEKIEAAPETPEKITINNRIRRIISATLSSLNLFAADKKTRLNSAGYLAKNATLDSLFLIEKALQKETDPEIKTRLMIARSIASLGASDAKVRLRAVEDLKNEATPATRQLLSALLVKNGGVWQEPDAAVRSAATVSLKEIERKLAFGENLDRIFTGLSLGSLLLLAAMGLAITYGVMGIINMAHGELLMIGAYATYVVQSFFRLHFPEWIDWYLPAALPCGFLAAALIGMILERLVIRHLYGRPLETLLATWGLSLFLIQTVRTFFGAQNVEVANPTWMSGGIALLPNLVLPWNRIVIIGFAVAVLAGMWAILNLTRLGLFIRAVTQNRSMSGCVGVPTGRIDTLAFGLGAGIAGLGGVALTQVSNVGPDMGQNYIVDSFMVVVLGGVGQLAGAVWAALGLGVFSKFLEGWSGAVIAKIAILVFIIVFIQKRPQGIFALKGRTVES
ncbi:MAG: urea ABC transporter permease subunit UrtB [Deltaproteobacteria bacterium]|nr:urea ABC transporter permease subunit UrtB [Deltaproteobacteria bacterium]